MTQWQQNARKDNSVLRCSADYRFLVGVLPIYVPKTHLSRPCLGLLLGGLLSPMQPRASAERPDHLSSV